MPSSGLGVSDRDSAPEMFSVPFKNRNSGKEGSRGSETQCEELAEVQGGILERSVHPPMFLIGGSMMFYNRRDVLI